MAATEDFEAVQALAMGRYRLGERLGSGGFGTVFASHDERLDRPVAVKVIPADDRADERAQREALAVARLDHPGIVALYDAGEEDGARYVVSELVQGRTLARLEADGDLTDRDVLRIGLALADALAHAHDRGVVHRDVKPQNVIVPDRPVSARGAAKLTDFGVAHLAGDDGLTGTGDVVGTLAYMAPEQAAGKPIDDRTDLYALALVLYEALAGTNPVKAGNPAATARRVGKVLRPLQRSRPDLPPELCDAVDRALLPDPGRRGELEDLAEALAAALPEVEDAGGLIAPHPVERAQRGVPPVLLRLGAGGLAGALVAAALLAFAPGLAVPPAAAGAVALALVAAFPRASWLVVAVALPLALLIDPPPDRGLALLLAAAAAAPPLLLRRAGLAWSLPAAAPALGLIGLAGAFPALAACVAGRDAARAGLAAAGAWWLVLAEPVLERTLLLGAPAGVPKLDRFQGDADLAANAVLEELVTGRTLALAAIWAAAAVALPHVLRARHLVPVVLGAAAWAGVLAAVTGTLSAHTGGDIPYGLVPGGLAAAALAIAAWWVQPAIIRGWK